MFGTMRETFAIELSRDACFARLAEHRIGRLALSVNALPTIVPVRYAVIGHELLIGEVAEASIVSALENSVVAFEADTVENAGGAGWVVCVVGKATEVVDTATIAKLRSLPAGTGGSAPRGRYFRVTTERVTGRAAELQQTYG